MDHGDAFGHPRVQDPLLGFGTARSQTIVVDPLELYKAPFRPLSSPPLHLLSLWSAQDIPTSLPTRRGALLSIFLVRTRHL